tara:strand:+ start:252 stop:791 length:540 start_codon:yes stop_codon:yes gene_type:complete
MKVDLEGIGPVFFDRSRKARNISISVKYPDKVRIAVPYGVSFQVAEDFALSKISWIKKNISKLSNQIDLNQQLDLVDIDYAKSYLINRLRILAEQYNFTYNKVSIRNQRTRWGSCSFNNNISLNIKLVCLPKYLSDYVILHELVHTKIKNHSPSFWSFLNKYIQDAKKIDKALKRYSCS